VVDLDPDRIPLYNYAHLPNWFALRQERLPFRNLRMVFDRYLAPAADGWFSKAIRADRGTPATPISAFAASRTSVDLSAVELSTASGTLDGTPASD
jgi:hypothetical protein